MGYIKLKKLTVSGESKNDSIIEFGSKLTIIAGPSETGKSTIYRCLDYIFGAKNESKKQPLDITDGYTEIKLELETNNGGLVLNRSLNSNVTNVTSSIKGIESGEYLSQANKTNPKTTNDLFLKLLGLKCNLKLPSNKDGKPASFSWRTLKKAFYVEENRADDTGSILVPSPTEETLFIAGLVYFLTNDELENYIQGEDPTIKDAKLKAIVDYITNYKKQLESKKVSLETTLMNLGISKDEVETRIDQLTADILEVNDQIEKIAIESKNTTTLLVEVNERLAKNQNAYKRYEQLKKQYESEIKRLTFIVDNEDLLKGRRATTKCPYCESSIVPKNTTSYIEASQIELRNTITNSNELDDTSSQLKDRIDDDRDLAEDLNDTIKEYNEKLKNELIPKRDELKSLLDKLKTYISTEAILSDINSNNQDLDKDIEEYNKKSDKPLLEFKAKQQLYTLIHSEIVANCRTILEAVGYSSIESIEFEESTLDLIINGKRKNNRSKGYKSFTNSVLLLAFRKYIEDHSENKVGMYFYDSPLKGLSLPEGEGFTADIRKGFFDYLIGLDTSDQMVIIENTKYHELPALTHDENTKIYKFTQLEEGRYGFLADVKAK